MSYSLGVDLGTTFVAAAVARGTRVEMLTLGDRTVVTPAVVFARDDGRIVTGDAANRRAVSDPQRVGRGFKRRLGDPAPVLLGGSRHPVTSLLAAVLSDAVSRVRATEGGPPDRVVLTHPASWGPYRRELFDEVPHLAGIPRAQTTTEPQAAVAHHAAAGRLRDGEAVAVYDLGGGTFDVTVLRKRTSSIDILGVPQGIERLGGDDFDDAVLAHIDAVSGGALSELDLADPQTGTAMARLRQDCTLAKEALSVDTEATIPVFLPNRHFDVRLTRAEFEDMIRPHVESTIGALIRTLQSARVDRSELSAVLLVGGSSRIPLVARMITEALRRPTLVDTHPEYAVALGAAALAAELDPAPAGFRGGRSTVAPRMPYPRAPNAARAPGSLAGAGPSVATPPAWPDAAWAPAGSGYDHVEPLPPGGSAPARAGSGLAAPPGPEPSAPPPDAAERRRRVLVVAAAAAALVLLAASISYLLVQSRAAGAPRAEPVPSTVVISPAAQYPETTPSVPPEPVASAPGPVVGAQVPVGPTPGFVAIAPNGRAAYVANRAAGVVTVVDTTIDQATATIAVPDGPPQLLAFSPDGAQLYVGVSTEPETSTNRLAVLDTASNAVLTSIPVGSPPFGLDVSPDGSRIYVPSYGTVSVIDTGSDEIVDDIRVDPHPHRLELSADGTRAYTANHESDLVSVLDTGAGTVLAEIPVQTNPHSLAVHPGLPLVAAVNYGSDSVSIIDTTTDQVVATIPVGTHPQDLAWAPDGRHLYVVNVDSDDLTVIATEGFQPVATVPTGDAPTSIAVLPDGTKGYVTNLNSGTLTVLDLDG
ncbi:Hsp70 family protein [Pseudonocardia humida]|uniref:Hsp70 family protein n=1 Tax=Pseudonocardia humida TaxID=2800819 RepID=A0ABT1A3X9_9PSEU|nr:Hsp70 family protein [Pseudonocardia humida]MCO1657718.1 Hsp70 family protein [Pseudonocardia humida]